MAGGGVASATVVVAPPNRQATVGVLWFVRLFSIAAAAAELRGRRKEKWAERGRECKEGRNDLEIGLSGGNFSAGLDSK